LMFCIKYTTYFHQPRFWIPKILCHPPSHLSHLQPKTYPRRSCLKTDHLHTKIISKCFFW
jgi:hypothetical protein